MDSKKTRYPYIVKMEDKLLSQKEIAELANSIIY